MRKLLLLLPFFIFLSCTVQKRKYQGGFYIASHGRNSQANSKVDYESNKPREAITSQESQHIKKVDQVQLSASAAPDDLSSLLAAKAENVPTAAPDSCDIIIFRDGNEIAARVLEISSTDLKYKKCEMPEGPDYVSRKADVFMIRYANGQTEHFKAQTPAAVQTGAYPAQKFSRLTEPKKVHSDAVLSLIMGIIGIVFVYYGSIHAIILGSRTLRIIRSNPTLYEGESYARAGIILGIIKLAILFLFLVILIAGLL